MRPTGLTSRTLAVAKVDLRPGAPPPAAILVALAIVAALAASLGADALLVRAGTALFPSTEGYAHFGFSDYSELTAIGVVGAGLAWPAVTRATSQPRWLFFRLAIVVSAVLLLPDLWLLAGGAPTEAVIVLVAMHLAVGLITYNLLVRVAPPGITSRPAGDRAALDRPPAGAPPRGLVRVAWIAMASAVGVEFVLGIAVLVAVHVGRADAWVPAQGRPVYLAHAVLGGLLGVGAALLLIARLHADRLSLYSALVGAVAAAVGAGGGVLAVAHATRPLGMALMLAGALVAVSAYLAPLALADGDVRPARSAPAPSAPKGPWDERRGRRLVCFKCGPRPTSASGLEERVDRYLAARACPLCSDRPVEAYRDVWICWCCETVFRRSIGDQGEAVWVVTPGQGVAGG